MDEKEAKMVPLQPLTPELLAENMNVLGVISAVETERLRVCLPNGLIGTVPINYIFSKKMEQNVPLRDIFQVGYPVVCQVKAVEVTDNVFIPNELKRAKITLSIKPKHVNNCLSKDDLQPGTLLLSASVKSEEDHGFVIDIGVRNITAFLSKVNAESYVSARNKGRNLLPGQIIPCVIGNMSGNCVNVSCKPKLIDNAIATPDTAFRALIPGTRVNAVVSKIFTIGLVVRVYEFDGGIRKEHLKEWLNPSDYSVNATVDAVVLYTEPISKVIFLSLDSRLWLPILTFPGLAEGDLIKDAILLFSDKYGAQLKLKNKYKAICSKINFPKKMNWFDEERQMCRVIGFNFMGNYAYVSMNPEHLTANYITYSTLKAGDILDAVVTKVYWDGLQVEICPWLRGFVPKMHVSDTSTPDVTKFRSKDKIKCRVLLVDANRRSLILSAKPLLVKSKHPPVVSYADLRKGQLCDGVISYLTSSRIGFSFFNDVKGSTTQNQLKLGFIDDPESHFFKGQTVTCKVIACKPEEERLFVVPEISGLKEKKIKISELYNNCKIIKVSATDIEVDLGKKLAFLPICHLSDYEPHCALLHSCLKKDDILPTVIGFSNKTRNLVSMKQSLLSAVGKGSELTLNQIAPGVIKSVAFDHIILQFFGDSTVRVKHSKMEDQSKFAVGLSMMAKVTKVHDSGKVNVSTSLKICWDNKAESGINLLSDYLRERDLILQRLKQRESVEVANLAVNYVGKIVLFEILKKTDYGLIGKLESNNVTAIVSCAHMDEDAVYTIGSCVPGVVICVDLVNRCVEVCLLQNVVKLVKCAKKRALDRVKPGQSAKAEVVFVHEKYVLVVIKTYARGKLAYLPTKRHLNDLKGLVSFFRVGYDLTVSFMRVENDNIIAVEKRKAPKNKDVIINKTSNLQFHDGSIHIEKNQIEVRKRKQEENTDELKEIKKTKLKTRNSDDKQKKIK